MENYKYLDNYFLSQKWLGRGKIKVNDKPNLIYLGSLAWIIFGIEFLVIGFFSMDMVQFILSPESGYSDWYPMIFFGYFLILTTLFVFGVIFVIFGVEFLRGKSWAWSAGVLISTIFLVIFGFMLGSLMITALLFMDPFSIPTLVLMMITLLIDLGVLFLTTRPKVKIFMLSSD